MVDELLDKIKDEYIDDIETKEGHKEKVEPISKAIEDMASLWRVITSKVVKDNICFLTKEELGEDEAFDIVQVPNDKVEKGMVAFVCVAKKNNTNEE